MSQPQLNHRLTSMDASFLYFEKKEAPMHIGSVMVFEGEVPFEPLVQMMDAKMHLLPRYQQLVAPDPFNLGHPTWEPDHNFDIRRHVFKVEIDAPGTEQELIALAGRIFSPVMERHKPLWDINVIYGLAGKRTAMICRVHHCMVDGVSGVDLMKILFDFSPEPAPVPPKPASAPRQPQVDTTRRFFDALLGGMQEGMDRWMEFQRGLLNLTQAMTDAQTRGVMQQVSGTLPKLAAPAASLPFNRPCSGERKLVWSVFSFAEARAIRAALGGTVNDVVLTTLSGAVARYVALHGQQLAGRAARFMVPVSMRQEEQRGALGNLVSMLPVEIPLDLPAPIERLRFITQKTGALKGGRVAEGLNLFSALMGALPAPVQALAGALATAPLPVFNMVSTNVPGPQVPLYALGKRMVGYYPYVPVGYAVGCGCAIVSYDQQLNFGLTADVQAMPDVERLKEFLDQSFAELRQAAGVAEIKPQVMKAGNGKARAQAGRSKQQ